VAVESIGRPDAAPQAAIRVGGVTVVPDAAVGGCRWLVPLSSDRAWANVKLVFDATRDGKPVTDPGFHMGPRKLAPGAAAVAEVWPSEPALCAEGVRPAARVQATQPEGALEDGEVSVVGAALRSLEDGNCHLSLSFAEQPAGALPVRGHRSPGEQPGAHERGAQADTVRPGRAG